MSEAGPTPAPNRRWFRFSLGTMFVAFTLAAILVGGWTSYQLDWIRKRRALAFEGDTIFERLGNYTCGATCDDIAPTGSTLPQRLLALFGEPPRSKVYVYYVTTDRLHHVDQDGEYHFETTDYAKVQRAQKLFPEAEIGAVDILHNDPHTLNLVKDVLSQ